MRNWLPDGKLPDASTKQGAFLLLVGTILNQNISGEQAWRGVKRLSDRVDLRPAQLAEYSLDELEAALRQSPAIHPFAVAMSRAIHGAAERVSHQYAGDARQLWRTAGSTTDLIARLTQLRQVGRHKAEVAVFLLATVYGEVAMPASGSVEQTCPALLSYVGT